MNPDVDDFGNWLGTCDECGTNHDGHLPGSFGALIRCLRSRAAAEDAVGLVDQVDALARDVARARDERLFGPTRRET